MRVVADETVCIGAGNCVLAAPDVFDQDDDGIVQVLQPAPPAELAGEVRDAVQRCPSRAITLR